jgi:hypothetical protein
VAEDRPLAPDGKPWPTQAFYGPGVTDGGTLDLGPADATAPTPQIEHVADQDRVIIVVHLPQPLDKVSGLLNAVARWWPATKVDTAAPDGWTIDIPADEAGPTEGDD